MDGEICADFYKVLQQNTKMHATNLKTTAEMIQIDTFRKTGINH